MKRQFSLGVSALVVFAKALLIAWALMFLAEHFHWQLFSEAGGSVVRTASHRAAVWHLGSRVEH